MKAILCVFLGALAFALPATAKSIRVSCGIGGAPNPHDGSMYVAVYRNLDMTTYRMMVWKKGLIAVEEDIVPEESAVEPSDAWPRLTAVMKGEHAGVSHTFRIVIDVAKNVLEHRNDPGNFDFEAEGSFEMSLAPGRKFPLVCDGVFNPR